MNKLLAGTLFALALLTGCQSSSPKPDPQSPKIQTPNEARIERLEFEKWATEKGKPYKKEIESLVAKYDAIKKERPLTQEEIDDFKRESKQWEEKAKVAAREAELEWRKSHPNTPL